MHKTGSNASLESLLGLVARLRGPNGCPWDREQEMGDMEPHLLEECYEVMEALHTCSFDKLAEELGDLLFHIVFLAHLASEKGVFDIQEVIRRICEKMIRRHPHVFGAGSAADTEAVKENWWKIKQAERGAGLSLLDSVPLHLPALQRACRLSQRAARVGLDWPDPGAVLPKVKEELREFEQALAHHDKERVREELGDLFFSLASLARHLKLNPEQALQESNRKFLRRFRILERRARAEGRSLEALCPEEMNEWWEQSKNTPETEPPD